MEEFSTIKSDEKYLEEILALWGERREQDYIEKRKILFNWLTTKNPYLNDFSPYYLLLHKSKIVGMHGHMPLIISVNGKERRGFLAHDDLIKAEYRGKGLGRVLLDGVSEQAKEISGACWFNEPNHKLYLKSGWLDVPNLYPYIKILDPGYFLDKRIKLKSLSNLAANIGKTFIKIKDFRLGLGQKKNIQLFEIDQFDERFDELFNKIQLSFGVIVRRRKDYLNWKFVNKPFNKYKRYGALNEKGRLEGYIVLKTERAEHITRGRILDILYNPSLPEVLTTLILKTIQECKKRKVSYITILSANMNTIKLLNKSGFVRAKTPEYFMVKNWERDFEREFIGNIQNWYLTYSDADGDAWNVDD